MGITTVSGTVSGMSPCDPVEMKLIRWRGERYYREMNRAVHVDAEIHGPSIVLVTEFMGNVLIHKRGRKYRFTGYWQGKNFCSFLAEPA